MVKWIAAFFITLGSSCGSAAASDDVERTLTVTIDHVWRDGEISGSLRNEADRPIRIMAGSSLEQFNWRVHIVSGGVLHTYFEDPNQIVGGPGPYRQIEPGGAMSFRVNVNRFFLPETKEPSELKVGDVVILVMDVRETRDTRRLKVWVGVASAMSVVDQMRRLHTVDRPGAEQQVMLLTDVRFRQ